MNRRTFLKTGIFASTILCMQNIFLSKAFAGTPKKGFVMIVAHIDDEIIWFLPWLRQVEKVIIASLPATSAHLNIVNKYAPSYDALWQWGRGITSTQDYKERWLNPKIRQDFITEQSYDQMLRDIIADPEITEIWTHNPYGEYSHRHHKDVSKIVRGLAVEYGKDVWCPNIVIRFPGYLYEELSIPYLKQQVKRYDLNLYKEIRQMYLDEPVNQTFPVDYWTWGNENEYYPQKYQKYFLAVSDGIDYTLEDREVQYLMTSLPIYGV